MLTRIRSRSTSVDTSEDSPNTDIALSRQSSSASSFYDSQDSAPLTESAPKRRRVEKTKLSDCKQRVLILPGQKKYRHAHTHNGPMQASGCSLESG